MGIYARRHAQQMILDSAPIGDKSALSPRAQLLLLHIAANFGGDENMDNRSRRQGKLWNRDAIYFEGLGRKARAMGYNVPERIDAGTLYRDEMTQKQVNAVKAAVSTAVKDLVTSRYLVQTRRGQTGQQAEYQLQFLRRACSTCLNPDGKTMNETAHLPQKQQDEADDRDYDHTADIGREILKTPTVTTKESDVWGKATPALWSKPKTEPWGEQDGWGSDSPF
jgi:hypothetical protein